MTTQHTPGPWVFDTNFDEITSPQRMVSEMAPIAKVDVYFDEPFASEQKANVNVIIAAPDLLEALTKCLRYGDGHTNCEQSYLPPTVREFARAAIAKATGEAI